MVMAVETLKARHARTRFSIHSISLRQRSEKRNGLWETFRVTVGELQTDA